MQDNNSSNQQVIDLGWQRMSTLLDKELPQTSKRRRFSAWWFVAAGIFLGLATLGYTALQSAQPDAIQDIPVSHTPNEVASSQQLSSKAEATPEEHNKQIVTEQTESSSANEIASTSTEKIAVKGNTSNEASVLRISPASKAKTPGSSQVELASSSVSTSSESSKNEAHIVQLPVGTNELAETEVKHIEKTESLIEHEGVDESITNTLMSESVSPPSITRSIISVPQFLDNNPEPMGDRWNALMIPVARPDRDGSFGLDAMVATHLNADADPFYGIEAGLSTTLISGQRISVHGGVSYGYYNVDGVGLGIFDAGNSADTENLGSNGGGGPDTNGYTGFPIYAVQDVLTGELEYSEAQELTETFHYIHVPLRVEYRILPRLLMMAGVKASVLLAAPARYRLNDNRFSAPQSTVVSNSKSFLYNYDIIRKIDIAPLVGLSYNIGDRLSLDATYSHGLRHYINSDDSADRNDYHRSASLGVRYRIL